MFFGSAIRPLHAGSHRSHEPKRVFTRDFGVSLFILTSLGAMLFLVQARPERPGSQPPQIATSVQTSPNAKKQALAHAMRDEAATPNGDEERLAQEMMAFALSKVSPLHPEPMSLIRQFNAPVLLAPLSGLQTSSSQLVRKAAKTQLPPKAPGGHTPPAFTPAEWPAHAGGQYISATPKDQPALVAMTTRIMPAGSLLDGAQSVASGAKQTVNYGVSGLRNGVSAVQEKVIAIAGRLW